MRRVSSNNFSSDQNGLKDCNDLAILLCSLTHKVCFKVLNTCLSLIV